MADKVQATDLTVTGVNAITLNAGDTLEILPGVRVSTDSGFAGVYSTGSNVTVGVDGTLFGDNAIFLASGSANDTVLVGTQGILSAFHNTVDIAGSGDSVTNSGQIMSLEGDGVSLGAGSHVTNSGSITGALAGIVATAGSTVDNSGTIQGGVQFTAGNNFLYNDNNGSTITGSVDMGSGGGKIDNDGYIHGDVDLGGATTRLNNNGTITGNIAGTGGATIFNYGTIDGSLSFSAASTYHGETGIITGSITGSSGDDNIFLGSNPYIHSFI